MKESIKLKFGDEVVIAQIDRVQKLVLLPGNPKDYKAKWGTEDEFTKEIYRTNRYVFENYDGYEFPTFGAIRASEMSEWVGPPREVPWRIPQADGSYVELMVTM